MIPDKFPEEVLDAIEETYFFIKDLSNEKSIAVESPQAAKLISKHRIRLFAKLDGNIKLANAIVTFASNLVIYKSEKVFH